MGTAKVHYLGSERLLTVTGDAAERAYQQGVACRNQMTPAASSIGSLVVGPEWVGQRRHERWCSAALAAAGGYYLVRHRPALTRHAGGKYWRAQRSLAQGAAVSRPFMFGLGAVPELVGAQMGYTLGCTALALSPSITSSGGAQIVYNHDFPPRFGRYNFVRRNHPTDGYRSVCLTYPIMVGCLAGVNERGLALTLNHAFATDYHGHAGILLSTLVQDCLDRCATVHEAVDLFTHAPVTNGAILTFADASGDRAAVERSCAASRTRRTDESVLASFNKYRHPDMEKHEVPLGAVSSGLMSGIPLHESNVTRQRRYDELHPCPPTALDEAAIQRMMSDHDGRAGDSNTICRHGDELSETLWGAILDTQARTLRVVFGHTCSGPYVTYGIEAFSPASRSPCPDPPRAPPSSRSSSPFAA